MIIILYIIYYIIIHNFERAYGSELRKQVRNLERTSKKLGRFNSHLHFNLQCKRNEITPKHSKIPGKWESQAEKNIIKRAEKAILNLRIGETVKRRGIERETTKRGE